MPKLYLYKREENIPPSFLLSIFSSEEINGRILKKVSALPFLPVLTSIDRLEEADCMVVPPPHDGLAVSPL